VILPITLIMAPSTDLPAHQAAALFDLLLHKQLYLSEVVRFNRPDGIDGYGPPFDKEKTDPSTSPILQTLLYRFIYTLPGLKSVSPVFWSNVRKLLKDFAGANLSQSYEHTGLGLRRTLGTGGAALLEYPARGVFGGLKKEAPTTDTEEYDIEDPHDLQRAFWHLAHECVYEDGIDQVFDKMAETSDLAQHNTMVQAAHEYILVNLASVLHHIFVQGPDAAYLQRLISSILNLIPWMILKQSLRLGNAASMINAVTRLFLTKLSLTSFTNWVGLSNNPDDGMNLLQQIASQVFGWDITEYQKQMEKISTGEDAPDKEHLAKLKEYVALDSKVQDKYRQRSSEYLTQSLFND
jgi:hypothetical protein